ncbi:MAG TPA: hypothetical protein VMD02_06850 [Candidatus Omnitrophota bacterium]|nr:hypothetical protein [Candidatus Omnitrophota bacterium]
MSFLFFSGVTGLVVGLLLIFIPFVIRMIERYTDRTINFDIEQSSLITHMLIGLAQIIIGAWLIYTSVQYPELKFLLYIGSIAVIFGLMFFFPSGLLRKLNDIGNISLSSGREVGTFERVTYGLIMTMVAAYILFIYFTFRGGV